MRYIFRSGADKSDTSQEGGLLKVLTITTMSCPVGGQFAGTPGRRIESVLYVY